MATRRSGPGTSQPSAAQKSAGTANLAKGRAEKEARAQEARANGRMSGKERWARLLDGTLTVRDLDDEEITRMKVRAKDGSFNKGRVLPSHIAQQFHHEAIRRSNDKLRSAAPEAVQALIDIGKNPAVKESDRVRALMYVVDRALGKTPENVVLKSEDKFADLLDDAASLLDDRDLDVGTPTGE